MPSQFSSIGFHVATGEDLAALASSVADRADTIDAPGGQYLKWAPPSGEQLWLQVKRSGDAMGMNPHFDGQSIVRATLEARVTRPAHTPLDGTFLAWANPPADGSASGDYPFVLDCPDAGVHEALELPATVDLQVSAFAQQIAVHTSEAAYLCDQASGAFASRSFIPSGLIAPSGEPVIPPESHALIAGHVADTAERVNSVSGQPYWWALLDTVGGTFDVVIDPGLLTTPVRVGHIVSGWFWLSGRVRQEAPRRSSWFRKLSGRGARSTPNRNPL